MSCPKYNSCSEVVSSESKKGNLNPRDQEVCQVHLHTIMPGQKNHLF